MRSPALVSLALLVAGVLGCGDRPPSGGQADASPEPGGADAAPAQPTRPEGVALCYTELSSQHPATSGFWSVLRADRPQDRAAAISSLEAAALSHPDEEEFALLLGLAHLWRIAEPLPSEENDLLGTLNAVSGARLALERAYDLCPTDHRIAAWLGPLLVNTGRALGLQSQVDEGLAILEQGIAHYPAFVLFSKLLIYADYPASSPEFVMALEAVEENLEYCAGDGPLGLSNDPACNNHFRAAHNVEGGSVFLGDIYVKAGRREDALATYQGAQAISTYAGWHWKGLLEDRIATIDARLGAYASGEAAAEPDAIWQSAIQCSICHRD